jgi:hypothetical protein
MGYRALCHLRCKKAMRLLSANGSNLAPFILIQLFKLENSFTPYVLFALRIAGNCSRSRRSPAGCVLRESQPSRTAQRST